MAEEVEQNGWLRKKVVFGSVSNSDILDFPELDEKQLKIFFCGSYQLSQSVCYLAELINSDGSITLQYLKETPTILRIQIKSRHINSKIYNLFIEYFPNVNDLDGIRRHYCNCPGGRRTAGCCSHLATVIYYLSNARYKANILKPADVLTEIYISYDRTNIYPVIEENSDDDN